MRFPRLTSKRLLGVSSAVMLLLAPAYANDSFLLSKFRGRRFGDEDEHHQLRWKDFEKDYDYEEKEECEQEGMKFMYEMKDQAFDYFEHMMDEFKELSKPSFEDLSEKFLMFFKEHEQFLMKEKLNFLFKKLLLKHQAYMKMEKLEDKMLDMFNMWLEKFYAKVPSLEEWMDFYEMMDDKFDKMFLKKDFLKLYKEFFGESKLAFKDQVDWQEFWKLLIKHKGFDFFKEFFDM